MLLRTFLQLIAHAASSVLLILAFAAGENHPVYLLPEWRRKLSFAAIVAIVANWCFVLVFILAEKSEVGWIQKLINKWPIYAGLMSLVTIFLTLCLKGRVRLYTVAAAFAMVLFWSATWIE